MTTKADYLSEARQAFIRRYTPKILRPYERRDFEVELDRLIYAAIGVGQEPFVRELEMLRETTIEAAFLSPITLSPKA